MNTVYHFWGLSRSGNHPVIDWIRQNSAMPITFYNDVYAPNRPRIITPEEIGIVSPVEDEAILLSYEDIDLSAISGLPTIAGRDKIITGATHVNILLIRDPFNIFASRKKHLDDRGKQTFYGVTWEQTIFLWKQYAREFLGETELLPGETILINYDQWFDD